MSGSGAAELIAARRASIADVFAVFDRLDAVSCEEMFGAWTGEVIETGHPGERALGKLGWVGKTFHDRERVDPIVCAGPGGERQASDVMGAARLRSVEYRGVVTATMVYDDHPIIDHFRRIDGQTLLGLMDRKGEPEPLAFVLRRHDGLDDAAGASVV